MLIVVFVIGLVFVAVAGLPYFLPGSESLQRYTGREAMLLLHITFGIVALLSGPFQLWLGIAERQSALHRKLGLVYMASIAVSAIAAVYLAINTDVSWMFGAGLLGLATAWVITTTLAFMAIRRHLYEQHKEWMIRSYVVTTGFVSFRIVFLALNGAGVGTQIEQLTIASWTCWAVPLLITEAVLQGRKILAVSAS